MKEFTLVRSPMCVSTVGKPLVVLETLKDMEVPTLERDCMYASNVGNLSIITVPFSSIKECMLGITRTSVSSAGRI